MPKVYILLLHGQITCYVNVSEVDVERSKDALHCFAIGKTGVARAWYPSCATWCSGETLSMGWNWQTGMLYRKQILPGRYPGRRWYKISPNNLYSRNQHPLVYQYMMLRFAILLCTAAAAALMASAAPIDINNDGGSVSKESLGQGSSDSSVDTQILSDPSKPDQIQPQVIKEKADLSDRMLKTNL